MSKPFYIASLANKQRLRFRTLFGAGFLSLFSALQFTYNVGFDANTYLSVLDYMGMTAGLTYLGVNYVNSRITVSQLFKAVEGNRVDIQTYSMLGNVKPTKQSFAVKDLVFFRKGLKPDYFFVRVVNQKKLFRFDCNQANTKPIEQLFEYPQLGHTTPRTREEILEDRFFERKYQKQGGKKQR